MATFDPKNITKIHQHLHSHLPSDPTLRVKALETILVEKGLVKSENIDRWVEVYADDIGPKRGAHVVARAWTDPTFKKRLLEDAASAVDEMGFTGPASAHLKAVENTDDTHNVVVCTLCSCYPFSVLGMAPNWYKTAAYRSRVVREPREVLVEFGVELSEDMTVHVWDSTAELRYLVIPQRPEGTQGMSADELAALVTRNSMIGTDRDLNAGDV
jgi:nitrile hydratase